MTRHAVSAYHRIAVGDVVVRILGGAPMALLVTNIDEDLIHCGGPAGWTFDRNSGWEVDEEIGWGPNFGVTGSYLLPPGETAADVRPWPLRDSDPVPPPFVAFRTATGSQYEVDNLALEWRRTSVTLASGVLRAESGSLLGSVDPQLGRPVLLIGPPFADGLGNRVVITTPVVEIAEVRERREERMAAANAVSAAPKSTES